MLQHLGLQGLELRCQLRPQVPRQASPVSLEVRAMIAAKSGVSGCCLGRLICRVDLLPLATARAA
eukprot:1328903-Lingulodinium_polyedra.AAC.1